METTNKLQKTVAIELELVYDVWSLLFCCIRTHCPDFKNKDYTKIFYRPVSEVLNEVLPN
jgi:hypothetical protein